MAETNFYSYFFARATEMVAFDELADVVELSSPESIQRVFVSYLTDYPPPIDGIKEALTEEKFHEVKGEGAVRSIQYEVSIPGVDGKINTEDLQNYFEMFLDKIGAENNSESGYEVGVKLKDDERGGEDMSIFMELSGKQIREGAGDV